MQWIFPKKNPKKTIEEPAPQARPAPRPIQQTRLDADAQPVNRALSAKRLVDRSISELIGICRGVLADGRVDPAEARFLMDWLERNKNAADHWPANVLYERLLEDLRGDSPDPDDFPDLLQLLHQITGDGTQPAAPDEAVSWSTTLPLDAPAPAIVFEGRRFVMTGKFVYGTRREVEAEVEARGGSTGTKPTASTDYVVIGAVGSRDWLHSSMGTKIQAAVHLREGGHAIRIVGEEHWTNAVADIPAN